MKVDISNASAHYGDYLLTGLAGAFVVTLEDGAWRLAPTEIRATTLTAGIDLGDIVVKLAGSPAAIAFEGISARAFGGSLAVLPFDYRLADGTAVFAAELAEIDLASVLAVYGERITGTGRIDGVLPVTLAGASVTITDGALAARAPGGVIRLAPELTRMTGQPGLDFALEALANFAYTLLSADVDYAPSGELALGVALQGRNPDVEGGRPIHYNLNVTENVHQLLESLTVHRRLVRDIERQVKE